VNPANTITGTEGSSIGNTLLTTFIDSDTPTLGDLSATINWGNGTSSSGTIAFVSGDTYDLYGSHTYFEEGGYTYSVTVDDSANSLSGGNNGSATIADAPGNATRGDRRRPRHLPGCEPVRPDFRFHRDH
jgi:hypothetical protein